MASIFDRYHLNAFERRLVVAVGLAIFAVVNLAFIWPRFDEWETIRSKMRAADRKLRTYDRIISKGPSLKARLVKLEGVGADVLPVERANQLITVIQDEAQRSKLPYPNIRPIRTSTRTERQNEFFDQKAYSLTVNTEPEALLDFLVAIGTGDSMIRVRDLDLKPEPPQRSRLVCSITLVASYQKQAGEGAKKGK